MSHSTRVGKQLASDLAGNLTVRELWRESLAPVGPAFVHAIFTPEQARTKGQKAHLALSDEAVAQIQAADVVVVAAGMINFGMPASLKTWIDLITRSGVTFSHGESGPEGLLTGKRLILVLAAGGVYTSGPRVAMDHLESALRLNLGFIGLTDVSTVWIDGLAGGEEAVNRALTLAEERSHEIVARAGSDLALSHA
jgi:FMN-dependent NADH-azoreductase